MVIFLSSIEPASSRFNRMPLKGPEVPELSVSISYSCCSENIAQIKGYGDFLDSVCHTHLIPCHLH